MIFEIIMKHAKFSYSLIDSQLLPSAPACGYKFDAFTVYMHLTFTAPNRKCIWNPVEHLRWSFFWGNSRRLQAVGYFCRRAPSWMFDRILNATLSNNSIQLALPPNSLHLHQTQKQKIKSWTDPASSFHFPETVQVFSNTTPIIESNINPQQNKNQSPLA